MYHGIINVYKEACYTSHDVVARLRGICKQKKIGHTGTLDPDAVGVLPVCLGSATKVCDLLTDRRKEYVACLKLGLTTDTQDISGVVLEEKEVLASVEETLAVIRSFEGDSLQVPPMYSALKVNGRKLYELAREGKEVERKARPITIYEIEVLRESHPEYEIRVKCSKGTYMRTLCHDIGQKLGCGGVMTHLTRTRVGEFGIEDAYTLAQLQRLADEDRLCEAVVLAEKLFESLPAVTVRPEGVRPLQNGNQLKPGEVKGNVQFSDGQQYRMYNEQDIFCGIFVYDAERRLLCPVKMFFQE